MKHNVFILKEEWMAVAQAQPTATSENQARDCPEKRWDYTNQIRMWV
jgi:hypothetical protein